MLQNCVSHTEWNLCTTFTWNLQGKRANTFSTHSHQSSVIRESFGNQLKIPLSVSSLLPQSRELVLCMYACIYMYACVYACTHGYVCMHMCMYICKHVCIYVCMCMCTHGCIKFSFTYYQIIAWILQLSVHCIYYDLLILNYKISILILINIV